ncbi:DNA-J domain protein [Neophasia sp. alphabaculovirus]|nr:DNA-J domain protein [Neophasia sp. alphabaculovirus]
MAGNTRATKRRATEESEFSARLKQNKTCNLSDDEFLGYCRLEEIDYYDALKLNSESETPFDEKFVLLVIRMANVVTKQIRKYRNLTDTHHNNLVHNVLIMIEHARNVLTHQNKKTRYDEIVAAKNTNVLKICDTYMRRLEQTDQELTEAKNNFVIQLKTYNLPLAKAGLSSAVSEQLQKWLQLQPIVAKRPTTMNRILVKWVLFPNQLDYNKHQIEQELRNYFKKFGTIVNVYVCDIETSSAIIEFATMEAQRKAIKESQSPDIHYIVTEYMLTEFYNSQLRAKLRDKINSIESQLNDLQLNLQSIQTR